MTREARPTCPDWRGWIAVAWAVFWGAAYAVTAIQARAPQVVRWVSGWVASGGP